MSDTLDIATLLREHVTHLVIPGAAFMEYGPEDYVGATLVVRGTLYFDGAHTPEVREAVCQCFERYEALASEHLTWLWRDSSPQNGYKRHSYAKAPPLRDYVSRLSEEDHLGVAYLSGKKPHDASPWEFHVFGHRAWQAKMGTWGPSSLEFSLPVAYVEENPTEFQRLFVSFARHLNALHGHGGYALQLSAVRKEPNETTEAMVADRANGVDAGWSHGVESSHIKTVGWLTAINHRLLAQIEAPSSVRSKLPEEWFALYDYGSGVVIQAGPVPQLALVDVDPKPATYVLVNALLKAVRTPKIGSLHHHTYTGARRMVGAVAEQWLKRFDIEDHECMAYNRKLLDEPPLTRVTTLHGHL